MSTTILNRTPKSSVYKTFVCLSCVRRISKSWQGVPQARGFTQHVQASNARPESPVQEPFRKRLKDEARRRRSEESNSPGKKSKSGDKTLEKWELTVGIEVHAELNVARKLFSEAATSVQDAPNTHVALFDAALPGTQPRFQKETLIPALRAALALNCSIQRRNRFDRKHYFYPDQPAGYQITQYYEPFAKDGYVVLYDYDGIAPEDGKSITVGIKQIQMEQDTAKTIQLPPALHLLDFNRVSHPLVEIITLPHIHHPQTAAACVRKIQAILRAVDAVTAGMEIGGLRADVNVSVRERDSPATEDRQSHSYHGVSGLGQRTEIKNLSSFKAIEDAIVAERRRQIDVLESGGVIEGETRQWTLGSTETKKLRGKEGEIDYRYMPDPDIPEVIIGEDLIQHLKDTLPMLPDDAIDMLVSSKKYNLTVKDAKTLVSLDDGARLDYYMDVVEQLHQHLSAEEIESLGVGRVAGNWIIHELGGLLAVAEIPWSRKPVPETELLSLLLLLLRKQITRRTAKQLLAGVVQGDRRPIEQIAVEENLLLRPMSQEEYVTLAKQVIDAHADMVRAIKEKGQSGKIMFLVGQAMRLGEEGRVEAQKVEATLKDFLRVS